MKNMGIPSLNLGNHGPIASGHGLVRRNPCHQLPKEDRETYLGVTPRPPVAASQTDVNGKMYGG